jgi:WD40 repeat protein
MGAMNTTGNVSTPAAKEKQDTMEVIWKPIQAKVTSLSWHPLDNTTLAFGTEDGYVGLVDTLRSSHTNNNEVTSSSSSSLSKSGSSGGSSSSSHVCEAVQLSAVRALVWTSAFSLVSLCDQGTMSEVTFDSSSNGTGTGNDDGGGSATIELVVRNVVDLNDALSVVENAYHATSFQWDVYNGGGGGGGGGGGSGGGGGGGTETNARIVVAVGTKFGELLFFSVEAVGNHSGGSGGNKCKAIQAMLWDTATLLRTVHCHRSRLTGFHWQHDRIATSASDGTIYVHQLTKEETVTASVDGGTDAAAALSFPLHSQCLVSFCKNVKAIAWNHTTAPTTPTATEPVHLLAGAASDGRVGIWTWQQGNNGNNGNNGSNGRLVMVIGAHHDGVLCCMWSSLHSNRLITGSADQTAKVWHIHKEDFLEHTPPEEENKTVGISTALVEEGGGEQKGDAKKEETNKKERKQRKRGKGSSTGTNNGGNKHNGNGGGKNKFPLTSLEMEVIRCGQLARVLCARMSSGTMTLELVALSPSCGMWREAALSYANSLQRNGKQAEAQLYSFAIGIR